MSATTFSILPFDANAAPSSTKSSFSQPPTITLTLASADDPPSPSPPLPPQQPPPAQPQTQLLSVPNSHAGAAKLSLPSPTVTRPSPPPQAAIAPSPPISPSSSSSPLKSALSPSHSRTRALDPTISTSLSPLSPTSASASSRTRNRSPARDRSPARPSAFSPKASSSAGKRKGKNNGDNERPPLAPPVPEAPPEWLTAPHEPVYQTHTTVRPAAGDASAKASRSVSFSRRKRKSTKVESVEERRERFYRLLHSYHIHASEDDLTRHEVIFPPGLLSGEGDMATFLGEFTALQSSYSALLAMLSSLPHLCLYLDADGCLASYNHDPSAFLGVTLTQLRSTPYTTWFSDSHTNAGGRHSFSSSRNQHFLSSVGLAYASRQAVRQEQCMFMPGNERVTPVTLTIVPVTYSDDNASSFDDRFTWTPPLSPTAAAADSADDGVSLSQHAFSADLDEQRRVAAERARATEEERLLREAERRAQIRGVHIIIESKEHMYRLLQNTKRNKEMHRLSTDKRRNGGGGGYGLLASDRADGGGGDEALAARDRSILIVEPKLDTSVTSALQLVGALQRAEKNARKRQMYADIMHMLANSRGNTDSVNTDVITQIEDSASVGADVKSWLINQINPTAEEKRDEADELIDSAALQAAGSDESSAENSAHSSIFVPVGRRQTTTALTKRASMAQQQPGAAAASTDAAAADTARDSTSTGVTSLRTSTINPRASQMGAHRPSNAAGSLSSARGGSLSVSSSASFSSPMLTGEVELPKALTQSTDAEQYVDTSGEVSLLKKQRTSNAAAAAADKAAGGGSTERQNSITGSGGGGGRTERRRTLKERKSLHEKKSLTNRASLAGALQKLPASTATLTSATPGAGPVVAPVRPALSLPLGLPASDKHMVIERAADARVLYNNWSLPGGSGAETSRDGKDKEGEKEKDAATADGSSSDEATIVVKEIVFSVLGCSVPEVHHNAALDCNAQPLFWSNALPYHSATRPATAATSRPHTLLHSPVYLTPSAESALAQSLGCLSVWNQFNIFHVSAHSQGWPLTFTFTAIVTQLNLVGKWGIDAVLLSNFIREVERGYFANPYHSSTHAADVLQHSYHMLTQTHLALQLSDLDIFLLLVAACLHDYGHPGVSNAYLTSTFSPLALQYNDRNVLESYHIASVFLLMQARPECNLFQHMDAATYRKARKLLVDLVLATDLASHFDILAVWKRKESVLDLSKDEDKLLVMQMILKSGDLGHPSRVRQLHLTWSELITEEFFQQGDRERKNGMNVSAMMDRHTCNIVTSQIGFISFLVLPIYGAFASYIGNDMYHMLVKANLAMWERLNVETEELKRQKEEEEWELRRLAAEKEEMETRRRKEADDRVEDERRKAEQYEEDMRKQAEEEEEKSQQAAAETEAAVKAQQASEQQETARAQRKADGGSTDRPLTASSVASGDETLGQAPPLLDMAIRRENDSEWTIAAMSDSESDEADEGELGEGGDKEEEAERQRRREKKQRAREVQQAKLRSEKQQEKAAYRARELEEKRVRELLDRSEAEQRRLDEERAAEEEWRRSREREEREIDERVRKQSQSLQAKYKRRGTDGSVDAGDTTAERSLSLTQVEGNEGDEAGEGVQAEADGAEEQVEEEVDELQLPVVEEEAEEQAESDSVQPRHPLTGDNGGAKEVEDSTPPEESELGQSRPLSPASLQQEALAARLKESIAKDRQRVEAERERERKRLSMERKKLMSAEERRAAEESDRLERRVRRVLKREQAKARAKAREEEVNQLPAVAATAAAAAAAVDAEATSSGGASSRLSKEELLEQARARERSVALRAVSLLMMDKEWGMKRGRDEEKSIMLAYLQSLPPESEQHDAAGEEGGRVGQSAHKVADEEWEDDAEAGAAHRLQSAQHRPRPAARSIDSDADSATDASGSGLSSDVSSDSELPVRMRDGSLARSRKASLDRLGRARGVTPSHSRVRTVGEASVTQASHARRQSGERQAGDSPTESLSARRRTASSQEDKRSGRLSAHTEEQKEDMEASRPRPRPRTRAASKRLKNVSIQEDRNEVREHQSPASQAAEREELYSEEEEGDEDELPLSRLFEAEEAEAERRAQQQRRAQRRVEFAEEEKVMLSEAGEAMAVDERQRRKDKQRAMQAQKFRETKQQRAAAAAPPRPQQQYLPVAVVQGQDADDYPATLPSPTSVSSSHQSYSSPSFSSHPIASTAASFTSFPPLTPPLSATVPAGMKLVRTSDGQEVMMADSRLINQMMRTTTASKPLHVHALHSTGVDVELPFVTPSNPHSMYASRPLAAARAGSGGTRELQVSMASQSAELPGSDWRAVEDEQAMAAILRRVVPRSRQAELERARRAIMLKARMRTTQ